MRALVVRAPGVDFSMFNLGWGELVVIGIVALIAIGPKELPTVLRTLGQAMGKIRRMANEFQGQFQEALREAELGDLKKHADDLAGSVTEFANIDPLAETQSSLEEAVKAPDSETSDSKTSDSETSAAETAAALPEISVPMAELPAPVTGDDFAVTPEPVAETPTQSAQSHEAAAHATPEKDATAEKGSPNPPGPPGDRA
jgi:sec-independent protein translocase protein TatB